jgi:dTDP-4-amino-4,6-dideoxygalactose transaminase
MARLAIHGGPKTVDETAIVSRLKWGARYPVIDEEREIAAVVEVLRGRQLSIAGRSGPIAQLEDELCRYYGVPYALTFNCGTAALHSAYLAAGVGPGTEVITSPYTWVTNVTAILAAGGIPVFADINPDTFNLDPESVARQVTAYTRAISVTHLYGCPADMDPIGAIAEEHGLIVIEDASQAHGSSYKRSKVGTIGHMSCFSLQAGKQMVAGEGGFLLARDAQYYERALLYGHHPARLQSCLTTEEYKPYAATGLGYKYRMPSMSAALARAQLPMLDLWNQARIANANRLITRLQEIKGVRPPVIPDNAVHTFYMFAMKYVAAELGGLSRQTFIAAAAAEGIPVLANYCSPIHLAPLFQIRRYPDRRSPWEEPEVKREVFYREGDCPIAEQHAGEEMLLYFPRFTEECPELMDAYAEALAKVAEHAEELREPAAASRAGS